MQVYESSEVAAPPQTVWEHVTDPQRMADWHEKLVEVRRTARGPLYAGERFGTTYVMSKKRTRQQVAETEVLRCEPWTTLVLRHHLQGDGRTGYVDETFQLLPQDGGRTTRVEHAVDFAGAGLPLWMRAIMWCVTRTGRPQGEGILEPLKRACEMQAIGR
jgi:uncharacterized protein YndB with AHSA1/START domain